MLNELKLKKPKKKTISFIPSKMYLSLSKAYKSHIDTDKILYKRYCKATYMLTIFWEEVKNEGNGY